MAEYDAIGDRYSEAKHAPWRLHLEAYTLERLAGDVRGARILDLACGDGFYSRRLMARGAASTLGVDVSAEMIALANRAEAASPLGCRYLQADVNDLEAVGEFDMVIAAYLLNYARTSTELRRLADVAYARLRPGGRFIGVNDYTADTAAHDFVRHGFRKHAVTADVEGEPVRYDFLLDGGRSFEITNYYWRPTTYLEVLREAGFREPAWHRFDVSPDAGVPPDYWDDYFAGEPCACLSATR